MLGIALVEEVLDDAVALADESEATCFIVEVDTSFRIARLLADLLAGYRDLDIFQFNLLLFLNGFRRCIDDHTVGIYIGYHILEGAGALLFAFLFLLQFLFLLLLFLLLDFSFVE